MVEGQLLLREGLDRMNILLNAFDSASQVGPFPNLAIMKLAAWHKSQGDEVALVGKGIKNPDVMPDPDQVFVSVVFDWNKSAALGAHWMYPEAEFFCGGSGMNLHNKLPPEVENMEPDYEIYDNRGVPGWRYAVGFSSRGCNRKCPFCIVPAKEGRINSTVPMESIVGGQRKLLLLDNNFTQDPDVENKLKWLANWGGKVNFSQGVDARVIERQPHLAGLFAKVKFTSKKFDKRLLTLAYDHPGLKKIITRAVGHLKDAGINIRQSVQFYVLINYNTTHEQDLARIDHLRELGTMPYVMIYDKKNAPDQARRLQRWCNQRAIFWSTTWKEYQNVSLVEAGYGLVQE